MTSFLRSTGIIALGFGLTGCNQLERVDASGVSGGGDDIPPEVRAAFERSCGKAGCHVAGAQSPTLAGDGIGGLIGAPSGAGVPMISLGDTANSYIALKVLPDEVLAGLGASRNGARMPLGLIDANAQEDIQTILAWIGGADFPGGGTGGDDETTGDAEGSSTGGGEPLEPTWANIESKIFAPTCSCHLAPAGAGNGNLSLESGKAYANIINVKSKQATTMNLVTPMDPANSYLFLKINGEFLDAPGGSGDQMPQFGTALSEDLQLLMQEWIEAGAPN